MRYLVSGGGTGGHVYPALAVARALRDARSDVELDYVGGVRGFERRIVADDPMRARAALPRARRAFAALRGPLARTPSSTRCAWPRAFRRPGGSSVGCVRRPSSRPAATWPFHSSSPRGRAASRPSSGRATSSRVARRARSAATRRASRSAFHRPWPRFPTTASCPAHRSAHSPASTVKPLAARSASGPKTASSSSSAGRRP